MKKTYQNIGRGLGRIPTWAKAWNVIPLMLLTCLLTTAHAATVTMTTGDSSGTSSFNTAGHWDNGQAPTAGNDYFTGLNNLIRTPPSGGNFTFAGDSLTIDTGGRMAFKGGTDGIITVNNLTLNGGIVHTLGTNFVLGGNIIVASSSSSLYTLGTSTMTVASSIAGNSASMLQFTTEATAAGSGFVLVHANNTYQGGTLIRNNVLLDVQADGALGTGSITVSNSATLKLELGATNNYINDSASLIVSSTAGGIVLNFAGTDSIGALSLDNGTTFLASGTYGAVGSGATFTSSLFTGTGMLLVVPEPSSVMMLSMGCMGLFITLRKRAKTC